MNLDEFELYSILPLTFYKCLYIPKSERKNREETKLNVRKYSGVSFAFIFNGLLRLFCFKNVPNSNTWFVCILYYSFLFLCLAFFPHTLFVCVVDIFFFGGLRLMEEKMYKNALNKWLEFSSWIVLYLRVRVSVSHCTQFNVCVFKWTLLASFNLS